MELAKRNAATAGVDDCIKFEKKHILETEKPSEYGCLVTNPPYGERLLDSVITSYSIHYTKLYDHSGSWPQGRHAA